MVPTIDGEVELTIPAGTQPGIKKTLRNRGLEKVSQRGSPRGDQIVTIQVKLPTNLTDKQKQLLMEAFQEQDPTQENKNDQENKQEGGFTRFFKNLTEKKKK
jgi:molecular chaperone DnaJ